MVDHSSSWSPQIAWAFFLRSNNDAASANAFSLFRNSFSKSFLLFLSSFKSLFSCFVFTGLRSLAVKHVFLQNSICSLYNPFSRQYAANSASFIEYVSSTTRNLSSLFHLSDERSFPGLA